MAPRAKSSLQSPPAGSGSEITRFEACIAPLGYLNMACLEIPAAIVKATTGKPVGRFLITVNDAPAFPGGLMSHRDGMAYIMYSKKNMKAAGVSVGDTVMVTLQPDRSPYGMPMPEELQVLLDQDPEANSRFHALTPGKQRNVIVYVSAVKNSQKRIDRSIVLMENLKSIPPGTETLRSMMGLD